MCEMILHRSVAVVFPAVAESVHYTDVVKVFSIFDKGLHEAHRTCCGAADEYAAAVRYKADSFVGCAKDAVVIFLPVFHYYRILLIFICYCFQKVYFFVTFIIVKLPLVSASPYLQ